jgi:hypothetical protein
MRPKVSTGEISSRWDGTETDGRGGQSEGEITNGNITLQLHPPPSHPYQGRGVFLPNEVDMEYLVENSNFMVTSSYNIISLPQRFQTKGYSK